MVDHSSLAKITDALDKGNSALAKLRAAADEGSPLRKVADLIDGLSQRLAKLEESAVEAVERGPIHMRRRKV